MRPCCFSRGRCVPLGITAGVPLAIILLQHILIIKFTGNQRAKMKTSWITRLYLWACQRLYYEFAWSYDLVSWLVSAGRWDTWRCAALAYLRVEGSTQQDMDYRVLEIGFGTGELLVTMAQHGFTIYGLELSHVMQRVTQGKITRRAWLCHVC